MDPLATCARRGRRRWRYRAHVLDHSRPGARRILSAARVIVAGDLSDDLIRFGEQALADSQAGGFVLKAVYWGLPDLANLSVRMQTSALPIPAPFVGYGIGYGLA